MRPSRKSIKRPARKGVQQVASEPITGASIMGIGRAKRPSRLTGRIGKLIGERVKSIDPDGLSKSAKHLREAPPLLLMPLRLEYRVVRQFKAPLIKDTSAHNVELMRELGSVIGNAASQRRARAEIRRKASEAARKSKLNTVSAQLVTDAEIWFRWYPDEGFTEKGVQPPTTEEREHLSRFRSAVGAAAWWDVDRQEVSEAWQALANSVGGARAIHLLRAEGGTVQSGGWEARIGRIAALPQRVALFAVTDDSVESLGSGADIPVNLTAERSIVSYTYEAAVPGGWLTDFVKAVDLGMGLKLTDPETVNKALAANWIVAVGLHGRDAQGEIQILLADRISNGDFEFLAQDSPTNNAPGVRAARMDPLHDLLGFVRLAAQKENGAITAEIGADTASSLLARSLGIDATVTARAPRAADTAFEDARAMLRAIGPVLVDDSLDGVTVLEGVDEDRFVEVMANAIVARGALPAFRSGNNAYGIATVTDVSKLDTAEIIDETERKVHDLLKAYSLVARQFLPEHADRIAPVIHPGDQNAAVKLEQILKTNRVSVRLDVGAAGSGATTSIGCPYVSGSGSQYKPGVYLQSLRMTPLNQLADPDQSDRRWPLLYRLIRLALTRNTLLALIRISTGTKGRSVGALETMSPEERRPAKRNLAVGSRLSAVGFTTVRPNVLTGVRDGELVRLRHINTSFVAALKRLENVAARDDGRAQLEMLMMETIDLFQHRTDAWATGLAFERLCRRRTETQALRAGYYGFIGKLRPKSETGHSDGYIQAPSMAQATSAAVMRSAYLRNREEGAFAINLRSKRARRAMALLELLTKGLSLAETLGLRGERWLHDTGKSRLTYDVRQRFPLANQAPPDGDGRASGPAGRRGFDGLGFIDGRYNGFPDDDQSTLKALAEVLKADLDALSDLVMAEAVHQRALGAGDVANAWLQVVSGGPVPGSPAFLRTQRQGQGSTHRISLILPEAMVGTDWTLRAIAEPALAAFAETALSSFGNLRAIVTVWLVSNPAQQHKTAMSVENDLGMSAIDFLIGGRSEVLLRARHRLVESWLRNPGDFPTLGSLVGMGIERFIAEGFTIDIEMKDGDITADQIEARAEYLRKLVQKGRPVEPSDLNAAASPIHKLDEQTEIRLVSGAHIRMQGRARALMQRLGVDLDALSTARREFVRLCEIAIGRLRANASDATFMNALTEAEGARRVLVDRARMAAGWAEPALLRNFTLQEGLSDLNALDAALAHTEARMAVKLQRLNSVQAPRTNGFSNLSEARAALTEVTGVVRSALDGEALPVLPDYERVDALRPLLNAQVSAQDAVGVWATQRQAVANTLEALKDVAGVHAHQVSTDATRDDDPDDDDGRTEQEATRALHFGVFLGARAVVQSLPTVRGIVTDEWASQRPSETQVTGIAINYDSPQSEPPHCLLLCVPPDASLRAWDAEQAAKMVRETIAWMKIRSLSTSDKPTPSALLPNANQVALKKIGSRPQPRIPKQSFGFHSLKWFDQEGQFVVTESESVQVGITAAGLTERGRFSGIDED